MKKYKVVALKDGYLLTRYGEPTMLFDTLAEAASFAYILEYPNKEDDHSNIVENFYTKYSIMMLRAALKKTKDFQLAEDAVHQAFVKIIEMLDKIDDRDEKRTGGLLCLMAQQAVTEIYNKKERSLGETFDELHDSTEFINSSNEDLLDVLLKKDGIDNLKQSLCWLSEEYRTAIILKYSYQLSSREIAEITKTTVNLVHVRIHRAKQRIKKYLSEGGTL